MRRGIAPSIEQFHCLFPCRCEGIASSLKGGTAPLMGRRANSSTPDGTRHRRRARPASPARAGSPVACSLRNTACRAPASPHLARSLRTDGHAAGPRSGQDRARDGYSRRSGMLVRLDTHFQIAFLRATERTCSRSRRVSAPLSPATIGMLVRRGQCGRRPIPSPKRLPPSMLRESRSISFEGPCPGPFEQCSPFDPVHENQRIPLAVG